MSRTHSTRHKWKAKERTRTGESDPDKIRLHRERFIKADKGRVIGSAYRPVVSMLRLDLNTEEFTTTLQVKSAEGLEGVETFPYSVADLSDLKPTLLRILPEIDTDKEEARLQEHVDYIKATKKPCQMEKHLEGTDGLVCLSAINCQYRKFDDELQLPLCCR